MAITKVGESQAFSYTGKVQEFIAPFSGLYMLEVWGARGGGYSSYFSGGKGGRSRGFILLNAGDKLFVVVGGKGTDGGTAGGYNGGGTGTIAYHNGVGEAGWHSPQTGGGGATHIAKVTGLLSTVPMASLLIVAGGGSGGYYWENWEYSGGGSGTTAGQPGGGLSGGGSNPGTQTSGYAYGVGTAGGGGGYFGGKAYSGGSGYIDGVPALTYKGISYVPSSEKGVQNDNGKASITYVAKGSIPLSLDGTEFMGISLGSIEITGVSLGDKMIY